MDSRTVVDRSPDAPTRAAFEALLADVPKSAAAWAARLATLRNWRTDPHFEPYAAVIDHMLTVDFPTFRRMAEVNRGGLDGCEFDACREQREYDAKHVHDHFL